MNPTRSSSGSNTIGQPRRGLSELQSRIAKACEFEPESRFYLERLLFYIKRCPSTLPIYGKAQISSFSLPGTSATTGSGARAPRLSQIVVTEGHLSPECVVELASRYPKLPLEFFLGHLELERVCNLSRTSYELPALPSRRGHLVHVRLPTLWRCNDSADEVRAVHSEDRVKADKLCIRHEQRLLGGADALATRFRKVHMHGWRRFTVEQVASLCLIPDEDEEGAWTAVYALDSGKPLPLGSEPFPRNSLGPRATAAPTLQPTVRYNQAPRKREPPTRSRGFHGSSDTFTMHPYHPCEDFGDEMDLNPFFALSSLLGAASASWNQVLNFIDEDIEMHQDVTTAKAPAVLAQIRFDLGLVHRFQGIIQQDAEMLSPGSAWEDMRLADMAESECTTMGGRSKAADSKWAALARDYESLLARCASLSRRCESASQVLQSTLMLLEHQKSQAKTDEINRLTKMGLFFFPTSLVGTLFGSNVIELDGANKPGLWLVIVVALGSVMLCSALYYFPVSLGGIGRCCSGVWANRLIRRGSSNQIDDKLKEP